MSVTNAFLCWRSRLSVSRSKLLASKGRQLAQFSRFCEYSTKEKYENDIENKQPVVSSRRQKRQLAIKHTDNLDHKPVEFKNPRERFMSVKAFTDEEQRFSNVKHYETEQTIYSNDNHSFEYQDAIFERYTLHVPNSRGRIRSSASFDKTEVKGNFDKSDSFGRNISRGKYRNHDMKKEWNSPGNKFDDIDEFGEPLVGLNDGFDEDDRFSRQFLRKGFRSSDLQNEGNSDMRSNDENGESVAGFKGDSDRTFDKQKQRRERQNSDVEEFSWDPVSQPSRNRRLKDKFGRREEFDYSRDRNQRYRLKDNGTHRYGGDDSFQRPSSKSKKIYESYIDYVEGDSDKQKLRRDLVAKPSGNISVEKNSDRWIELDHSRNLNKTSRHRLEDQDIPLHDDNEHVQRFLVNDEDEDRTYRKQGQEKKVFKREKDTREMQFWKARLVLKSQLISVHVVFSLRC